MPDFLVSSATAVISAFFPYVQGLEGSVPPCSLNGVCRKMVEQRLCSPQLFWTQLSLLSACLMQAVVTQGLYHPSVRSAIVLHNVVTHIPSDYPTDTQAAIIIVLCSLAGCGKLPMIPCRVLQSTARVTLGPLYEIRRDAVIRIISARVSGDCRTLQIRACTTRL